MHKILHTLAPVLPSTEKRVWGEKQNACKSVGDEWERRSSILSLPTVDVLGFV